MSLTNETVPQHRPVPTTDDPFPGITARPLQLPDFMNIKPKNSTIALRFVNRSAGGGMRLDQMTYAGFVPAKPEDCLMPDGKPVPPSLIQNGQIIFGDLICMKIARSAYDGALKYNFERAVNRLHPKNKLQTGRKVLSQAMAEVGAKPDLLRKMSVFQPGDKDFIQAGHTAEDLK